MDSVVDSWSAYEYPVLVAIAKRAELATADMMLPSDNVLDEVVTSAQADQRYKFERALTRLDENGYIRAVPLAFGQNYPSSILGITERGLRTVGAWPSPDNVVTALLQRLEEQANAMATSKPEESKRLKEVVGFFAGAGREVLVNVITGVFKQATGLP
jgi:hypothetical protein